MAARTDSVCRFICEAGDWRVTNQQLQKILYFAQMCYLGTENERLADTPFEAWDYGPVAPGVHRQVRMFGSSPIRDVFFTAKPFAAGSRRREVLADTCRSLLELPLGELVAFTHWRQGAWARNYVPGQRGTRIPDAHIIDEYNERVGEMQTAAD